MTSASRDATIRQDVRKNKNGNNLSLGFNRIPASIEREAVQYAEAQHITAEEAFVEIFTKGLKATKKIKAKAVSPFSDEELANLDRLCPALKLLDDVTNEEWDNVLKGADRMNREGFANRV